MSRLHDWSKTHATEYKYEIILVLNAFPDITNKVERQSEKDKGYLCSTEVNKSFNDHKMSSPSTKWTLFQALTELGLSNIKVKKKLTTFNCEDDQVAMKGKPN